MSLTPATTTTPGVRLAAALDAVGQLVTAFVPPGYDRYVRLLNPMAGTDGSAVSWRSVLAANDLEAHPWTQWDEVTALADRRFPPRPAVSWAEPEMGNPHPQLATALIRALEAGPGIYNFATWAGYADEPGQSVVDFSPSAREMVLYSGPLVDPQGTPLVPQVGSGRVPMYWWPDDLQWCVGQDIYARSLIVGTDLATAGRILSAPDLDAYVVRESDLVLPEDV
ncbi:hypothetical protein PSET11_00512 [Arthrobacter ulcerisalmonis]|uniref:Uncharacterized protein n=1 Tax=Arthrobacter ulcerisalmonis TaxID=2483813 RepID=A0A3P5WFX6_9MICC|nr:hypothetical protein [Arthrobacter ulcerisalmonis]VDC20215.1 hypothetical protein PSET11_00512 [Arthrobacter ulcerisalmonis]